MTTATEKILLLVVWLGAAALALVIQFVGRLEWWSYGRSLHRVEANLTQLWKWAAECRNNHWRAWELSTVSHTHDSVVVVVFGASLSYLDLAIWQSVMLAWLSICMHSIARAKNQIVSATWCVWGSCDGVGCTGMILRLAVEAGCLIGPSELEVIDMIWIWV